MSKEQKIRYLQKLFPSMKGCVHIVDGVTWLLPQTRSLELAFFLSLLGFEREGEAWYYPEPSESTTTNKKEEQ